MVGIRAGTAEYRELVAAVPEIVSLLSPGKIVLVYRKGRIGLLR
jgi:hypothetical protein